MDSIPPPYSHFSYGGSGAYANNNAPPVNKPNANVSAQAGPSDYFNNSNAGPSEFSLPGFNDAMNMNSSYHQSSAAAAPPTAGGINSLNFDILAWHPAYQSCQRFFLDHAQHEPATQAVCALINIRLPFQWQTNPISSSQPNQSNNNTAPNFNFNAYGRNTNSSPMGRQQQNSSSWVSPVPYIRRLVVTGFDNPAILHGFFGDDYVKGVMPHVECERRNYLFAAKHGGWRSCKKQYDTGSGGGNGDDESLPFMKPMGRVVGEELDAADQEWSKWLAFEDWMVGPRAVEEEDMRDGKRQSRDHSNGQAQARDGARYEGIKVESGVGMEDASGRSGLDNSRPNNAMADGYGPR